MGGSPGLVVMGRDSCSKGRGFESWHSILDGHFSHIFIVKNVCNLNFANDWIRTSGIGSDRYTF